MEAAAASSAAAAGMGRSHAGATTKKRARAQGAPVTGGGLPGGGVESCCVSGPGVPAGESRQLPIKNMATVTRGTMMMTPNISVVSTPETVASVWDLDSEEEDEDEGPGDEEDARDPPAMRRSGQRVVVGSDEPRVRARLTAEDTATSRSKRTKASKISEPRPQVPLRETPVSFGERRQEIDETGGGAPALYGGAGVAGVVNGGHAALSASKEEEETLIVSRTSDRARQLMPPPPPNVTRAKMRRRRSRVTLMHSPRWVDRLFIGVEGLCLPAPVQFFRWGKKYLALQA